MKKNEIIIHFAVLMILFLSPMTVFRGESSFTIGRYLMLCVSPVLLVFVFYLNYLKLTPMYYQGELRRRYLWLINFILVIVLGILNHLWMSKVRAITDVEAGRLTSPLPISMDVFFILRDIFNLTVAAIGSVSLRLARRWHQSEDARLEAEAARVEVELRNLRSQINPHFLLNTLNNIYALISFNPDKAQYATQQLSQLLRHMLYDNMEEEVELTGEVKFLESYVDLMQIRLPANVEVTFKKNIRHPQLKISPLIFISLVENAFKHGVSPTEPSFILIEISTEEGKPLREGDNGIILRCTISNTNHPKNDGDHSGHGIGLTQVQRRLDISYPGRYAWNRGVSEDGKTYRSEIVLST